MKMNKTKSNIPVPSAFKTKVGTWRKRIKALEKEIKIFFAKGKEKYNSPAWWFYKDIKPTKAEKERAKRLHQRLVVLLRDYVKLASEGYKYGVFLKEEKGSGPGGIWNYWSGLLQKLAHVAYPSGSIYNHSSKIIIQLQNRLDANYEKYRIMRK